MIADLERAFNQVGASMYSDDLACELLAWFHTVGGNNEAAVLNTALNGALMACAAKLNIGGGLVPDARLLLIYKAKVKEIEEAIANDEPMPEWIDNVLSRYGLREPAKHLDF